MSPSLQSNIGDLIYWTFLHNSEAIALLLSMLVCLGLLFWRPQRLYVVWLVGFTLLLARFEYLKHVVDPLTNQTLEVVIRTEGHYRASKLIDIFFYDLVPIGLYLGGWGALWFGLWTTAWKGGSKKSVKRNSEVGHET